MEVKERIVDIRQYFIYLWEKKISIILVTLLFALILIGVGIKRGSIIVRNNGAVVGSPQTTLDSVIQQTKEAYNQETGGTLKSAFAEQPYGTYRLSRYLNIEFNYDVLVDDDSTGFVDLNTKYQRDAIYLFCIDTAYDGALKNLPQTDYSDMSNFRAGDLKYMIETSFVSSNLFKITVIDVDKDRAEKIADEMINYFLDNSQKCSYIKSVTREEDMDSTTEYGIQDSSQSSVFEVTGGTDINVRKLIKYSVFGAAVGFVMMVGLYLILFIFVDTVRTENDLAFAGVKLLGYISKKNPEESYKRVSYNISTSPKGSIVALIPVDKKAEKDGWIERISDNLKTFSDKIEVLSGEEGYNKIRKSEIDKIKSDNDIVLVSSRNYKDYFDGTYISDNSDEIIMVVCYGRTTMKNLINAIKGINRETEKVKGAIIIK